MGDASKLNMSLFVGSYPIILLFLKLFLILSMFSNV